MWSERGFTYGNIENELLVDVAEEVRRARRVEGLVDEYAPERVIPIFIQAVELLAIESLKQRDLEQRRKHVSLRKAGLTTRTHSEAHSERIFHYD